MPRSFNHTYTVNDELYTPPKLVNIILPYLPEPYFDGKKEHGQRTIWCPFSTADSEFVRILQKKGYNVVHSHISEAGGNFFEYEPENWDIAIDNPPFSKKDLVFERLFRFGKPFAMVSNLMMLNYQCIGKLFLNKHIQMLIPDKKISFNGRTSSFCSVYICSKLLPQDIIFCDMKDNNTGENFEPAFLYSHKS